MATAIEFNHVSKQYRLGLVSTKTLSHDIRRWWLTSIMGKEDPYLKIGETNDRATKGNSEYVWALRDIDFKVEQGDVVGIIGKNGAGKSTLLKLLSRVTGPTTGTIRAHGRIGSLLEVGTGFHGEMTGRENIFMNGAILGMTRNEIQAKLDEIIDFSGCERYIDTPVKRYSSGMTVRLGFAVAAFLDPEILVVDEVLAVGDAEFQNKAIGKMKDVSTGEGRTVLFVSHNMESILRLCKTGVLLKNGMMEMHGKIEDVVAQYQQIYINSVGPTWSAGKAKKDLTINSIRLLDSNGQVLSKNVGDEDVTVELDFDMRVIRNDITLGVSVYNEAGKLIYRTLDTDVDEKFNERFKVGRNVMFAHIPTAYLKPGQYMVTVDASYHNNGWIIDPNVETDCVVSFIKEPNRQFSAMQSTGALIAPVIGWQIER